MSSFRRRSARYVVRRAKRNSERVVRAGQTQIASGTQGAAYTYTATQPCTVRSIKLDLGMTSMANNLHVPYVLVVVREGYNVNQINYPAVTNDLYNPTMDVLISGVLTDNAVEDHKFNSIGRKLKIGDRIRLVLAAMGVTGSTDVSFEMSFSVLC